MNEELQKAVKKYNKIYVIELFAIAAVIIVLATLKLVGIIGSSSTFRRIFNIITLVASTYLISDFIWLCCSKKRQKKNSWFDKISLLPFAIAMIVFDIICLINWGVEELEFFAPVVAGLFYYISVAYIAQGIYHIKKPSPAIVIAAIEEYNDKLEKEKKIAEANQKEKSQGENKE